MSAVNLFLKITSKAMGYVNLVNENNLSLKVLSIINIDNFQIIQFL